MHADNFVINDGTARQAVKGVAKLFPHFDREAATAFVVKAINPINAGTLVVASQQKEILWVFDFVGKQQRHNFQRLLSAIDVIP